MILKNALTLSLASKASDCKKQEYNKKMQKKIQNHGTRHNFAADVGKAKITDYKAVNDKCFSFRSRDFVVN